jgi:O-acetyl-ADP-ribose deacetylase (regulator of RNase III)
MIETSTGNLLEAPAEALVNTVNTVGVMGKGIALQFKKAFPENFAAYEKACKAGDVKLGSMFVVPVRELTGTKYIINFPTKAHWRADSKIESIESGLKALIEEVKSRGITSIAIPPLGCGNGGLQWSKVRPLIERAFADLPEVRVLLFEPTAAPSGRKMLNNTKRPNMTKGRAAVVCLMSRYSIPTFLSRLSMLEVQKLAYFVQVAGEDLRLKFTKAHYGPYADDLRKVLSHIDGHFIDGFGDGQKSNKPDAELKVLADAVVDAEKFLAADSATQERFARTARLIEGFETPFGMELLSTVHWVMKENPLAATDASVATECVHAWNERKKSLFAAEHVQLAWNRLKQQAWA